MIPPPPTAVKPFGQKTCTSLSGDGSLGDSSTTTTRRAGSPPPPPDSATASAAPPSARATTDTASGRRCSVLAFLPLDRAADRGGLRVGRRLAVEHGVDRVAQPRAFR